MKKVTWIMLAITILLNTFIFHNSLQDIASSNAQSGKIEKIVEPIVEMIAGPPHEVDVYYLVRKAAHFIEFYLLGVASCAFVMLLRCLYNKHWLAYDWFYVLFVAVIDEYIQSFTGRTSSVGDILLDFSGAFVGILTAYVLIMIVSKMRKKINIVNV